MTQCIVKDSWHDMLLHRIKAAVGIYLKISSTVCVSFLHLVYIVLQLLSVSSGVGFITLYSHSDPQKFLYQFLIKH